jgi:hypothetical protein
LRIGDLAVHLLKHALIYVTAKVSVNRTWSVSPVTSDHSGVL